MRRTIDYIRKNPRILFFLYVPAYLAWFALLEHFITTDYYVSYMKLDDAIPFVPAFILAYVMWYPFLVFPAAYLYFRDEGAFVRFGIFFVVSFTICLFVCTVFPNGQNLRPADTGSGFFSWLVARVYQVDTNTNVLPSMHVVGCAGILIAAFDSSHMKKARWPLSLLGALIVASTVFVKQHSMLDVFWGLAVACLVALPVYLPRLKKTGTKQMRKAS